ncbi:MAG: hypothetical protein DRP97_07970 [Candidatus Latescibacterota bacterium]|nr:MAG: hypothetical protein DRP97_07970 [Candidatus Latescibacterota bacterium]
MGRGTNRIFFPFIRVQLPFLVHVDLPNNTHRKPMCQVFVGTKGKRTHFSLAWARLDRYFKIGDQGEGERPRPTTPRLGANAPLIPDRAS